MPQFSLRRLLKRIFWSGFWIFALWADFKVATSVSEFLIGLIVPAGIHLFVWSFMVQYDS